MAYGGSEPDLYQLLGVPRSATIGEIRSAYRRLARDLHPDRRPDDAEAEERFKAVSRAYQVLSDKRRRALYDEFGHIGLKEGFDAEAYRGWQARARRAGYGGPLEDLFRGGRAGTFDASLDDVVSGRVQDVLDGGARRRGRMPRRGRDLTSEVRIGFVDALRGLEREVTVAGGSTAPRHLRVRIPAGVRDGEKVRLRGKGAPGGLGGSPGDLVLHVQVDPHPVLRREGDDLHLDLPVTLAEAYGGAKVRVPTLEGPVSLAIPRGAQGGSKLRLRGKGAPGRGGQPPGDMIVHLRIQLPPVGSPRTQQLLEEASRSYEESPRANLRL